MSELVLLHHNEPMTTSLAIAEGTENTHESVIKLVRKYVEDLQNFGPLGFEIQKGAKLPQGGYGKASEYAYLNEPQATLLITYLRNSETVRRFKIALVKAFYEMRDRLRAAPGPQFTTGNLAHGADLAVAADRTFRSFMRAARTAGMRLPQALMVANRQTVERTGMDMLAELGIEPPIVTAVRQGDAGISRFFEQWLAGETPLPPVVCRRSDCYAAYVRWCAAHGNPPASHGDFVKTVNGDVKTVVLKTIHLSLGAGHQDCARAVVPISTPPAAPGRLGFDNQRMIDAFATALKDWLND